MIKHKGKIVQFGFGAVGKSFYEKISKEICFDEYKYFVITRDENEFEAYINLGGIASNFIVKEIDRNNYQSVFSEYLEEGDLLIDFADSVGTKDFVVWCAENNIMYINTGETDWADHWYSIFNEHDKKSILKERYNNKKDKNLYPIVLQHGNNPGLVSHFLKAGINYIINSQFKKDKQLNTLLREKQYNKVAQLLGIKMIHVNDIDLQEFNGEFREDVLYNTWCVDSFWFEMLSESTFNIGTHEQIDYEEESKLYDKQKGYFEFKQLAADTKCHTYYPNGEFEGYMVPHEETITIAKSLEVKEDNEIIYRPSVMFLYSPCKYARDFLQQSKGKEGSDKTIIRGYAYPDDYEILYPEKISSGTEYVGVLILGDKFNPVWVGNRIERSFLNKDKKSSLWQTPTITPVAISALAAVCWMLKHKEEGGIYFPDDIMDYSYILKIAEKYISKTIYKTFTKKEIENSLGIKLSNPQTKKIIV